MQSNKSINLTDTHSKKPNSALHDFSRSQPFNTILLIPRKLPDIATPSTRRSIYLPLCMPLPKRD
ncbi:hypothetical protein CEZ70_23325, partial [Salmonella enterica]|nr:hypothetical protein [Salmonella enterica]